MEQMPFSQVAHCTQDHKWMTSISQLCHGLMTDIQLGERPMTSIDLVHRGQDWPMTNSKRVSHGADGTGTSNE